MEKQNEQKRIMREFWKKNKERFAQIRSIDKVYEDYVSHLKELKSSDPNKPIITEPINKYIFRTYIRKNGYCNSGALI